MTDFHAQVRDARVASTDVSMAAVVKTIVENPKLATCEPKDQPWCGLVSLLAGRAMDRNYSAPEREQYAAAVRHCLTLPHAAIALIVYVTGQFGATATVELLREQLNAPCQCPECAALGSAATVKG